MAESNAGGDVWPLGKVEASPANNEDKWNNCNELINIRVPALKDKLAGVFVDNISDHFNFKTGACPEAYYFTDVGGNVIWYSSKYETKSFSDAYAFAIDNHFI